MRKDFSKIKEDELAKELNQKRAELQKIKFTFSHGGNKDTKKQSNLKREISKILTEIRNRELRNN
ncbi:MAG: 50S ribosomal protein L29 [Candidatus Paceibacterota bacterium]